MKNKGNKDFYLSHYSTDREYSLESTKKQINLDLGLGDDFDHSFGEAMRKGLGGEEMQLPQQALRVLSEAKENMDLRLVGKQGRKGSLGMGLFKESREREAEGKKRIKVKDRDKDQAMVLPEEIEEAVIISDSDPLSPTLFRGGAPHETRPRQESITLPPALPVPITTVRRQPSTETEIPIDDLSHTTAALELASPSRAVAGSPQRSGHKSDIFSEESGWTTTDSDNDGSSSASSRSKRSEEMESTDEDEGESMTVPLQPFNHAVGGHSSIYKFTRRAVCKVSSLPLNPI
jgi:inositol-hexakisphosphate kinase